MVSLNTDKISKIISNNNNIVVSCPDSARKGEKQFMYFSFNQQYEIGLTANIYRPYVLIHSRYLKSLGDKLLYSTAYIMDYILKFHPHAFSWRHLELIPEIILVNRDPNFRYYLSDIMKFLSRMYIRETTNGMFMYKFYKKQSSEIQLLTKVSEGSSAAFNFTLDESLHIIRYYRRKLEQLQSTHTNFNNEYIHSIGFIQGILGDLYYFEREYDEAIVYYTDSIQVLRRLAQQEPQKMTKHQVVLYVRHKLLLGLCLEKIKAFDSAYSIYRGIILNIPRLLEKVVDVDVPQVQMNASILSDDEWDKPIRRMQLFIKPHIALLDLIEKQRMDGITYANLSRNFTEVYEFLIDSGQNKRQEIAIGKGIIGKKKKMDSMRVSLLLSDYYANVGSLLFFKNRNFPELHELLNHHLLTNSKSSDFQIFIKQRKGKSDNKDFNPSLSSFTYYYLALNELIESYMPKLRSVGKAEGISIDELKDSDNAFVKTLHLLYPEYLGVVNTAILFIFGNLLSRLGDTLLASLSRSSLENYQLKSEVLSLFSEDDMNEILFGVRKTSMKEAKDGKRKDSPIIDAIRNLLKKEQNKSYDKNDLRCQLSTFCDINTVLVLYRLAGLFYMKSGRTYSYAFQYKKLLFVLKDYLLCSNQDSYLSKIADTKDPKETYKTISSACENIAERIFSTTTWVSDVANRPQILKYRDIFKYQKMDVSEQLEISKDETRQIYLSLSTSAEIREVISITEEIKIKLIRILHIEDSFGPKIKSNITSYDLLTNRFSRVHELRYQSELNYFRLQIKHMDTILKSPILSDINLLGPIRDLKILKDIGAAILKDGKKVSITSICENAGNQKLSANKIHNIDLFVKQQFEELITFPNKKLSKKEMIKAFPEFFLKEHELKLKEILSDSKVPEMICDSIFALYEVIRTLNLFGISYMSNHSFLANIHFKLANWCQIAANYDILSEYESKNDSLGKRKSMQETLREILKEEDNYSLEPNYHNELAIQHYYSALESHSEGNAYKSINQSMSFLEDDFNDNLTHFSAASERFRINAGLVNKKIVDLKRKIRFSNLYTYQHYLAADDF